MSDSLFVTPHLTIPGSELSFRSVRASGPGGQNVNKVSSKVELRFDFARSTVLDEATKERLRRLGAARLDAEGRLVVVSQITRDRLRNLEDARGKLAALLAAAVRRPKRRRPTRVSRAADARRLDHKRQHSLRKTERARRDD